MPRGEISFTVSAKDGFTKILSSAQRSVRKFMNGVHGTIKAGQKIFGALSGVIGGMGASLIGLAKSADPQSIAPFSEAVDRAKKSLGLAIGQSEGFQKVIKSLAGWINKLTESGTLQLWAERVSSVFSMLSPIIDGIAKAVKRITEGIQQAATFIGTLAGGGTFKDAAAAASIDNVRKTNEEEMAAAKARADARQAELDLQSRLASESEANAKFLAELQKKTAEEQIRLGKEDAALRKKAAEELARQRLEAEQQISDLIKERDDLEAEVQMNAMDDALDAINEQIGMVDARIAQLKENLAPQLGKGRAGALQEFIAAQDAAGAAAAEDAKVKANADKLRAKMRRGITLSKRDAEELEKINKFEKDQKMKAAKLKKDEADLKELEKAKNQVQDDIRKNTKTAAEELIQVRQNLAIAVRAAP